MSRLPRLTRRLVLEAPQRAPDGAGGFVDSWAALGTLWAEVVARSGRERAGAGGALSHVPYRITVRGAPAGAPSRPRPEQRFREGARIFRILSVAEADAQGHYLICQAEEEGAA